MKIPLVTTEGLVRAHAFVDPADYGWLAEHSWRLAPTGYAVRWTKTRRPDRRTVALFMHRVILGLQRGDGMEVDHVNGDALDNRRANLRVCTRAENAQNLHRLPAAASRFRGVHKHGRFWRAAVRLDGQLHVLGQFTNEVEAAREAEAFRAERMPFAAPDPEVLKLDWPVEAESVEAA